jgi:hypothetical protein
MPSFHKFVFGSCFDRMFWLILYLFLMNATVQDLWRIKPQMMQKVLSSIGLSEDKKTDFAHVNHQAKGFNGCSEASSHAEMMELFPVSRGFGSNPRVAEKNITVRLQSAKLIRFRGIFMSRHL